MHSADQNVSPATPELSFDGVASNTISFVTTGRQLRSQMGELLSNWASRQGIQQLLREANAEAQVADDQKVTLTATLRIGLTVDNPGFDDVAWSDVDESLGSKEG